MPLPELTQSGELPLGVHQASLHETLERFGVGHPQRIAVSGRLNAFISWRRQPGIWFGSSYSGHS